MSVAILLISGFLLYVTWNKGETVRSIIRGSAILLTLMAVAISGWFFLKSDSKGRWLGVAVIFEWIGIAMLFLPSIEVVVQNKLVPLMETGKSLETAAAFFGLTATIWLASGTWLTRGDVSALHQKGSQGKIIKMMISLMEGAHHQIALGLATAIIGIALLCASVALSIFLLFHPEYII